MAPAPDLKARLLAYHAALQPFDRAAVAAAFAAEAEYHSPGIGHPLRGREAIGAAFAEYFARFPDQHSTDERIEVLDGTRLLSHWRLTATDRETGQTVTRRGTEEAEFNASGEILRITVRDEV